MNTTHLGFEGSGTYRDVYARDDADVHAVVKGPVIDSHVVQRHRLGSRRDASVVVG